MADAITQLPPGFVLDQPTPGDLPPGFVLDKPAPAEVLEDTGITDEGFQIAFDPLAERGTILPIGRTAEGEVELATPEFIKGPIESFSRIIESISTGEISPVDLVEVGFIASPAVAGRLAMAIAKPTVIGRAGEALAARAEAQTVREQAEFLDDLVSPKQTSAVKIDRVLRTSEPNILTGRTVEPTAFERDMADAVGNVPGISKKNTMLDNIRLIDDEVTAESKRLVDALKKTDVIIPKREFDLELDLAIKRLQENPLIVGDAAKTALKVVNKMKQIVEKNTGTGSGLLKSRKELDAFIKKQRPKIFDPAQESALSTAVREVRQTTNKFIDDRAIDVDVKNSLKKQSSLLSAIDNIKPKVADEGRTAIERLFQRVSTIIPIKDKIASDLSAVIAAMSFVGTSIVEPKILVSAIAAGAGIGGFKALKSPAPKKALSQLLKITDQAIRKTKDSDLISQLRLDRAVLVEILDQQE